MKHRTRVLLAAMVAVVGVVLAWRALDRSERRPARMTPEVSQAVVEVRDSIELDTPVTAENGGEVAARLAAKVRALGASSLLNRSTPIQRADDLAVAAHARVAATLAADYDANLSDLASRGDRTATEATDEDRENWLRQADASRPRRIGIEQVRIRTIYEGGVRIAPDPLSQGFSTTTVRPSNERRWQPADPVAARLDIVEVLYPAEMHHVATRAPAKVLIGWQFMWDKERSQWTPWTIQVYYTDHADAVFAPPF